MEKDAFTTNLKERLRLLVQSIYGEAKGGIGKFADSLDTTPGHVRDWIGDARSSLPGAAYLGRIYDIHKVNLNWLIPGDVNQIKYILPKELSEPADFGVPPPILPEHVQSAFALIKDGLGKHRLPVESEGYILGLIAQGLAEGHTSEYLLKMFSNLVQIAVRTRQSHQNK